MEYSSQDIKQAVIIRYIVVGDRDDEESSSGCTKEGMVVVVVGLVDVDVKGSVLPCLLPHQSPLSYLRVSADSAILNMMRTHDHRDKTLIHT